MASDMQVSAAVDWIGAILDSIREMECPGENSLAVVKRDQSAEAPISKDDVLDAHEFLQRWHGTVTEVLAPRAA